MGPFLRIRGAFPFPPHPPSHKEPPPRTKREPLPKIRGASRSPRTPRRTRNPGRERAGTGITTLRRVRQVRVAALVKLVVRVTHRIGTRLAQHDLEIHGLETVVD